MYIYIYIYMLMHIWIHIYIYISYVCGHHHLPGGKMFYLMCLLRLKCVNYVLPHVCIMFLFVYRGGRLRSSSPPRGKDICKYYYIYIYIYIYIYMLNLTIYYITIVSLDYIYIYIHVLSYVCFMYIVLGVLPHRCVLYYVLMCFDCCWFASSLCPRSSSPLRNIV